MRESINRHKSSSTHSHSFLRPSSFCSVELDTAHLISIPSAFSTFSHSNVPSNKNASSFDRISASSLGSPFALSPPSPVPVVVVGEPSPIVERIDLKKEEFEAPVGIDSNPSSFAPAERIPAEEDTRLRSSSRERDCFARSRVRERDLGLVGVEEDVVDESWSDFVRRMRRGGMAAAGLEFERRERRERRT